MQEKQYKFKFSIVSAVYNVEPYLDEMIESIVNQDIGFKENVQLILVDDGSKDNSGEICDKWKEKYPDNIIVEHKANGGVSSARNAGLKYVEGKYINFIDSDDKFSKETLKSVADFFDKNEEEIDVVTIPLYPYVNDVIKQPAQFAYEKFNLGTRVISLNEFRPVKLLSVSCSFFHNRVSQLIVFDETITYGEDAKVVNTILLEKFKLGVVCEGKYLYRTKSVSITNGATTKEYYYISYFQGVLLYLIDYCHNVKNLKTLPPFIEDLILFVLKTRLWQETLPNNVFDSEDKINIYVKCLNKCCQSLDSKYILDISLPREIKTYILNLQNINLSNPSEHFTICYTKLIKTSDGYVIKGYLDKTKFFDKNFKLGFIINNSIKYATIETKTLPISKLNNHILYGTKYFFEIDIPVNNNLISILPCIISNNRKYYFKKVWTGQFFPVNAEIKYQFCMDKNTKISFVKDVLYFKKINCFRHIASELRYDREILRNKEILTRKKLVFVRLMYKILQIFKRKQIWLISDRNNFAGDNGEAFFEFLNKKHKEIKSYFILNKQSPDLYRLKNIGKVVYPGSFKHYFLSIFADKIISSQMENSTSNIISSKYVKDISFKTKKIFLQHGIIYNDLSKIYNSNSFDFDMFCTSVKQEYNSIINNPSYGFNERIVKLTGLARYDKLNNNSQKIITFMPTWRFNLVAHKMDGWEIKKDFKSSLYYQNTQTLLLNKRLQTACKKYGYKFVYFPHSNMLDSNKYFKNSFFDIDEKIRDYTKTFNETSLYITDYSSTAMDFAYLRKPIIYFQYDKNEFYKNHTVKEGYLNIEENGFGDVVSNVDKLIDKIIYYMKNNCAVEEKYMERINNFFAFHDHNNCERVYNEIIKLEQNNQKLVTKNLFYYIKMFFKKWKELGFKKSIRWIKAHFARIKREKRKLKGK